MKSAEIDGKSDYKHTHLHFYISFSINSFIGIVPLPSWSYDIIIISSNGNLDSYGNLHPAPTNYQLVLWAMYITTVWRCHEERLMIIELITL